VDFLRTTDEAVGAYSPRTPARADVRLE